LPETRRVGGAIAEAVGDQSMAIGDAAAPAAGGVEYGGRLTPYLLLSCVVACCGGFLFGYDLGISGSSWPLPTLFNCFYLQQFGSAISSKSGCRIG